VAIIQGIGYPNPNRSHFRSMDIWHTCEPDKVGTEGWLGRAIRDIDPHKENVLTGVNFGRGLPRALAAPGVPVASVGNLETYGVLTGIEGADQRSEALDLFAKMYSSKLGSSFVGNTSRKQVRMLSRADILTALQKCLDREVRERYRVAIHAQHRPGASGGLGTRICTAPRTASIPRHRDGRNIQLWQDVSQCCQRVISGP
jgi:hypothetical protein